MVLKFSELGWVTPKTQEELFAMESTAFSALLKGKVDEVYDVFLESEVRGKSEQLTMYYAREGSELYGAIRAGEDEDSRWYEFSYELKEIPSLDVFLKKLGNDLENVWY